jgi:hypothetical protein
MRISFESSKVQRIFALLDKWEWSLGDLLVNIFTEEVDEEGKVKDSGHSLRIQNFLSGSTKHTPVHVMDISHLLFLQAFCRIDHHSYRVLQNLSLEFRRRGMYSKSMKDVYVG